MGKLRPSGKRKSNVRDYGQTFADVFPEELNAIRLRRAQVDNRRDTGGDAERYVADTTHSAADGTGSEEHTAGPVGAEGTSPSPQEVGRRKALEMSLTGLAFSGGGIRSGTLAIGILQGLAQLRLLRRFDYLSTVSGGGYAGSWLAAWIKRDGDIRNVELQLDPSRVEQSHAERPQIGNGRIIDEEPEPFYHLRSYSNYLAPRPGTFTTDTWTLLSIYFRNLLINLSILIPATMAVVLLIRLTVWYFAWDGVGGNPLIPRGSVTLFVFAISLVTSLSFLILEQAKLRAATEPLAKTTEAGDRGPAPAPPLGRAATEPLAKTTEERSPRTLLISILLPLVTAAVTGCWLFAIHPQDLEPGHPNPGLRLPEFAKRASSGTVQLLHPWAQLPTFFGVVLLVLFLIENAIYRIRTGRIQPIGEVVRMAASFLVMGALGGLLFRSLLVGFIWRAPYSGRFEALATFGPPTVLVALVIAGFGQMAVAGHAMREYEREWRSRLGALILLYALGWLALFGVTLYLPWGLLKAGSTVSVGAAAGWVGSTLASVLLGKSGLTPGRPGAPSRGGVGLNLIASLGPPVFLVGLLAAVSMLVSWVLGMDHPGDLLEHARLGTPAPILYGLLGAVATVLVLMSLVDVNLFSLHAMYANRLTRCYLGASRAKRTWGRRVKRDDQDRKVVKNAWGPGQSGAPIRSLETTRQENRFSGFDPKDDFPLCELAAGAHAPGRPAGYTGPFPLINTALNLVAMDELAYQDRKAESFALTPLYCGSLGTGYARLPADDPHAELTLGRAMAISGAAADPNMGYNQSTAQTALMTVFNARLGWWIQNPNRHKNWRAKGPNYSRLLFDEFFGITNKQSDYVHLSDGGHFDNLGVYELVRRRCRYIVACDLAQDRSDASENLSNAIRLCRRDFGVRIEIDTSSLHNNDDDISRTHCAIGMIHYEDVDPQAIPGVLLFIRSSMTGDEPPDVRNYALNHPAFPHQSTADQFFDEAQFESYRALGQHIAYSIFSQAAMEIGEENFSLDECERFFSALRRRWFPSPANLEENAKDVAAAFFQIQNTIRLDPNLRAFSLDLYPELAAELPPPILPVDPFECERAELHIVSQTLQAMQTAWRNVQLEGYPEHPMNRGWSNVFRRCARTRAFHKHWPSLRAGFSTEFVRFCEHELRMPIQDVSSVRYTQHDGVVEPWLDRFDAEFAREWPEELAAGRGLADLRKVAHWIWLIRKSPADEFVLGIILIRPASNSAPGDYELVVWILGPHRNVGIGHRSFKEPFKEAWESLKTKHPEGFSIKIRLPQVGLLGGADKPREDLWLNFFFHFGFRMAEDRRRTLGSDLIMVKTHQPEESARLEAESRANGVLSTL